MGIVGIVAHSVNVADELEGTEDDIRVTILILNALNWKSVLEEYVLLKTGRTSEEDTEQKKWSFQFCVRFP